MDSLNSSHLADKRQSFIFSSKLGKYYLKLRKKSLTLGLSKSTVIPYVLKYIDDFSSNPNYIPQIVDFGCSEGYMMNEIYQMSHREISLTGIDFNDSIVKTAAEHYPFMDFYDKDIFLDTLKELESSVDIAICINTLHEIYSFYGANGHFSHERGKQAVITSLKNICSTLKPGAVLILFDGIEPSEPNKDITVKFKTKKSENNFIQFAKEYMPYAVKYEHVDKQTYKVDSRGFTKFITKYRFFDSLVWELEREETYQYFTEQEFISVLNELGLTMESESFLSPNLGEWNDLVEILDQHSKFPTEHVMLIGKKAI
jgi:SAM-dependent methyltransferase